MCTLSFNESCPVCGRKLMVPIEFLGLEVQCSHCKGFFRAQQESADRRSEAGEQPSLECRADQLLSLCRMQQADR